MVSHEDLLILKMTMAYRKEKAIYEKILETTEKLVEKLELYGFNHEIMEILEEKNKYIEQISEIEEEIKEAKSIWDKVENKNDDKYTSIRNILQEIKQILEKIMLYEEKNKNIIISQKQEVSNKLNQVNTSKTAVNAYKKTGQINPNPKFKDDKS